MYMILIEVLIRRLFKIKLLKYSFFILTLLLSTGNSISSNSPDLVVPVEYLPLSKRIPRLLVSDKIHDHQGMSRDRYINAELCIARPDVCDPAFGKEAKTPKVGFLQGFEQWHHMTAKYQFLVCTHGGGIDTSPKSWQAIQVG